MDSMSKEQAKKVMQNFLEDAYDLRHIDVIEDAIHVLYGREFKITLDPTKRMQFSCSVCNKNMSGEIPMAEHSKSVVHMKNLDKWERRHVKVKISSAKQVCPRGSLQSQLLTSNIQPVGLQMVEEYRSDRGKYYYKCILCQAHGKLDVIYPHILGQKHTDKYIKSRCILENHALTLNEREGIRKQLVKSEGINVEAIKTIEGDCYFPHEWAKEGNAAKRCGKMLKKKRSPWQASVSEALPSSSSSSSSKDEDENYNDATFYVTDARVPCSQSDVTVDSICASPLVGAMALPGPSTTHVPAPCSKALSKDEGSKLSVDSELEMLMEQMNSFIISESSYTGNGDLLLCEELIEGMNSVAEALREVTLMGLTQVPLCPERCKRLQHNKEVIEKILAYITKWYRPTYQALVKDSQQRKAN